VLRGRVVENGKYDIKIEREETGEVVECLKHDIKLAYPACISDTVLPLIKTDKKVAKKKIEPILQVSARGHIKNKSLYPLMKEREVLFFTLLGGEKLKGIVASFSRYEIVLHMKGGTPVAILRHGVFDARNKKGRCFLKSTQETTKDWKRSGLFVEVADGG
jgi:sRNA-binding regulator protein Hfq